MPRLTRFAIISVLSLAPMGCDSMPKRPDPLEVCQLDVPAMECICGPVGHPEVPMERKPIAYCDKATVFIPKEWEKVANWQDEMIAWGKRMESACRAH